MPGYGFKEAGELQKGDKVLLCKLEKLEEPVKVYNFEVKDWHTYYVSELEVLVHNDCAVRGGSTSFADMMSSEEATKYEAYWKRNTPNYNTPHSSWNDVKYIEKMDYYLDLDEYEERVSNLKILFLIELPNQAIHKLLVKFNAINNLNANNIGGKYNQIMGLEIVAQLASGWECGQRYLVRDYENGTIEFYCKSIEIVSV